MKIAVVLSALLLSGCANFTERQKTVIKVGAAALLVGTIAAHGSSSSERKQIPTVPNCSANPAVCQ